MRHFVSLLSFGLLTSGCPVPQEADEYESGTEGEGEGTGGTETGGDGAGNLPATPELMLGFSQVKQFDFSWTPTFQGDYYQLLERADMNADYLQVGEDIIGESISITMPLHLRVNASYMLRACNEAGCTDSEPVDVAEAMTEAVGYFKPSNTEADDLFGWSMAMSADGNTMAIGAVGEDGNAAGLGGDPTNNAALDAGAVHLFRRDADGEWTQQSYIKPFNTNAHDYFGWEVALSADGDTLAVSAIQEDSMASGVGGNPIDNSATDSGAVYMFRFDPINGWWQQAYIKASNTDEGDHFGSSMALSADGNTLAVGARGEDSDAMGVDGDQANDSALGSGAVYLFQRDGMENWAQQAYIKASNTGAGDDFGGKLSLAGNGDTLAVGAAWEDSSATGIDGDQADDSTGDAGAVYVYARDMGGWAQEAYVKPSTSGMEDFFGDSVMLSADGGTLAVGARGEDSKATGIDGDQTDDSMLDAGAVYVFRRDQNGWTQQAYVKASNTGPDDSFGGDVSLSEDGDTLAVGARWEDANMMGIGGEQADDAATDAGAAYVYQWEPTGGWMQHAYVKASNTGADDRFGDNLVLSADGMTLAVSAYWEDGAAMGVSGEQADDSAANAGAVYMY
jgi:hypothetical protein